MRRAHSLCAAAAFAASAALAGSAFGAGAGAGFGGMGGGGMHVGGGGIHTGGIGLGLGFGGYDGYPYSYDYYGYNDPAYYDDVQMGRSVAEGLYCATPVTNCALVNPAYLGARCTCRVGSILSRGRITQ